MKLKLVLALVLLSSLAFAQKTSVTALNNQRQTDRYNWQNFPSADLSVAGASKTITLPPNILGIDVTATATKKYYIYIDTVGTAEAALVTGGTYTTLAGGTVVVTTVNAHGAGYRVSSSTSGIQEALNDAGTPMAYIKVAPSKGMGPAGNSWPIYAPIIIQTNHVVVDFGGASLNCFTRDRCIQLGTLGNSTAFGGVTIRDVRLASSVAASGAHITNTVCTAGVATITTTAHTFVTGDSVDIQWTGNKAYWGGTVGTTNTITVTDSTHFTYPIAACSISSTADDGYAALANAGIEDSINGANIVNPFFSTPGGITGKFDNLIVVDNDQAAKITGLNVASGLHCSAGSVAQYCGNTVYAPGPFATNASVLYIDKANVGLQCNGNGVNALSGNTLSVTDSVIQGFSQFGIRTGTIKGGFGPTTISNVYQEVGICSNFFYPGSGLQLRAATGLHDWGPLTTIRGGEAPIGVIPRFTTSGNAGTQYNYFIVVKDSTKGTGGPLLAGYATVDSVTPAGSYTVSWPRVQGTATVTYDVLRSTGAGNNLQYPYAGGCAGGTTTACGSVATAVAQCTTFLCSFTDNAATATTNYTVTAQNYYPELNFWPGGYVASPTTDGKTDTAPNQLFIDSLAFTTNLSPLTSAFGSAAPTVTAHQCDAGSAGIWVTCPSGSSNGGSTPTVGALLLQNGPANSGSITANTKGRINIINNPAIAVNAGHLITLVDTVPGKTLGAQLYRPSNDSTDSFIGLDVTGSTTSTSARISYGAPISQSWYISNIGDGTNWKMRLDTSTLALKVAQTTTSDYTSSGGTFNIAASVKTIPWRVANGVPSNVDCTIDGQAYFQSDAPTLGQQVWFCKTNVWTLMTGGGGGGGTWNTISSPGGNQSLTMGNFSSTWTGGTALTNPILTITDTAADTYTGNLMQITVPATSTALGLGVTVPTGGTAITAQAGSSGYAIKVPSGQGNIGFNRLISTSVNAPTSGCSICFGSTDMAVYWNGSLASAMTLIQGGGAGPVHVGDTPGIDLAGLVTSRTAGQGLSMVPLAATGNGAGGDLTLTAGNGAGTGKNGIVRLAGGTGGTGGRGLVSLGTSGAGATWTNDNTNPPTQYGPVCVTTAGIAQQCSAGALEGLVGICMDNCTNTGSSIVVSNQWARGTFDGATVTSGDYVSASTTPGLLTDVGPSPNTTAMTIGIVGSNISGTDWNVFVFPQSPVVSLSNVVVTNPSGGNVILSASPTQTPLTLQAAATGTADIFVVKKFDGTTAMKVDTNGILTVGTGAGTITSTQFVSATANPASNAANNILRLAKTDLIAWRNNGNSTDLTMGVNNSDFLSLNKLPGITLNPNGGSFATTLTFTAPGQNQNLTIPDIGAASGTFAFTGFAQTFSNKSFSDAITFTDIATPANPAAGKTKLYTKAQQACVLTSAGVETCGVGGGGSVSSVAQTINGGASSGIFTLSGGPVVASGTLDTAVAGTSGGVPYFSTGTVLSSSAALTSNSPVLGGGAGATPKTIAGLTTDGTSVITVGVAGSVVGGIDFKNATSGTISLRPATGALGAVTLTMPAATDTLVGKATTDTLTNKTLTLPVIASISNSGTMTVPTGTDTLVGKATTDVFTNKTMDVEATGNSFTSTSKLYLAAGGCQNATASLLWDTPTTNPAVAACDTGTNVQKGIANFADGANTLSMSTNFLLPSDWSGAIDAKFRWFTTATTGNIVWQIATICVADGETSDPAYNTASTVTDAAKGTTLQDNDATITGITTTGCATGEMMYVKVFRDPTNGSDTLAATGSLRGVELTLRRTQ